MSAAFDPIYREGAMRRRVDSCGPQFAAMREGKIRLQALTKGHYPGIKIGRETIPGINSIGHWSGVGAQDWGLEAHRNEGLEITFLETGAMAFSVETKNYELRPGHFTITRPWQLHQLGAPNIGPGMLHWLILDLGVRRPNQEWQWPSWLTLTDADRRELTRKLRQNENPVWEASPEVAATFSGLMECVARWPGAHLESRMINLLNRLFLAVLVALCEQQTHHNPQLTSRRRTVELFLRDLAGNAASRTRDWTLEEMARACGLGVTAFSKYCREIVNTGGIAYLNHCRLDQAARALRAEPHRNITEIAFGCGFHSSQYFATTFKSRFRLSPGNYRRRAFSSGTV